MGRTTAKGEVSKAGVREDQLACAGKSRENGAGWGAYLEFEKATIQCCIRFGWAGARRRWGWRGRGGERGRERGAWEGEGEKRRSLARKYRSRGHSSAHRQAWSKLPRAAAAHSAPASLPLSAAVWSPPSADVEVWPREASWSSTHCRLLALSSDDQKSIESGLGL